MNGERQNASALETEQAGYDPETEIIMEILRQINAELDEIADRLDEIGKID